MGNAPRVRKRVRALPHTIQRAPDGSAFQKCDECGVTVAVALLDMHDCDGKQEVKKLKGSIKKMEKIVFEEPRSPFIFFMESYAKTCKARELVEINRQAFQKWKNMSIKEQWPYVNQAWKVENVYLKAIHQEINELSQEEDDEADSATVGKFSQQHFEDYENSDSDPCCDWPLLCPWH